MRALTVRRADLADHERIMSAFRHLSVPSHGAIELAIGLAIMAAPFVLGFSVAGAFAALVLGALIVGVALATTSDGRGGLPVSAHLAFDRGLAFALAGAAVVLAVAGDTRAGLFLALAALVHVGVGMATRYTAKA